MTRKPLGILALLLALLAISWAAPLASRAGDPLPSWRDGAAKASITSFVAKVTQKGGPDYAPPARRIAVFDNDGTLWAEQPMYFQVFFLLDRVRELAPQHPEWKDNPAVQAALSGDPAKLAKLGAKGIMEVIGLTIAGLTQEEIQALAGRWLRTARHPTKKRLFVELVYQPMLELLAYLRANGFKTFIVSGGGVDFIRAFAPKVYGIPLEQVIGTSLKSEWTMREGKPAVVKLAQVNSIDDKEGKPINIDLHIGQRPLVAVGNSDGDLAMLQWTAAGPGPRLMLLLHHDDAKREWAYDRKSSVGHLDKALDAARAGGWTVISMRSDFAKVFPADK